MPHRNLYPAALIMAVTIAPIWAPAQDLPPGSLLMARVRARVAQSLEQLPDCTCMETVQRYQKRPGRNSTMERLDTVRMQILFSGDHELYAESGSNRWEQHPGSFITTGMIGDGLFALHLKSLFVNRQANFTYRGDGGEYRSTLPRYDFQMPVLMSGYMLSLGKARGIVGLKGTVWVDPETYDLMRLEMHADDIPPNVPYEEATTIIDYTRVNIGRGGVLLPQNAMMYTVQLAGGASRNEIEFTDCREFHAESTLRFEPDAPPAAKKR